MTTQAELAALVRAVALDRDRAAFTELFDYFGPRLKGYLIRLGSDSGTAEEIMQDAMATLWNKAALFDPENRQSQHGSTALRAIGELTGCAGIVSIILIRWTRLKLPPMIRMRTNKLTFTIRKNGSGPS